MGNPISRLLGVCVTVGIITSVFWATSYRPDPKLYDGDSVESRPCKMCDGAGGLQTVDDARPTPGLRCGYCGGDGSVKVLIPGPNRPTVIWGLVVDRERIGKDPKHYYPATIRRPPRIDPKTRDQPATLGALANVQVVFAEGDNDPIVATTDVTGRFSAHLLPGRYTVEVVAPHYHPLKWRKRLLIERLSSPIWYEDTMVMRATAMAEEGITDDESRAVHGLMFVAGVSQRSPRRGFCKTYLAH